MGYRHGEAGLTKLEYGSYLAATLAYLMMRQQDSVGLIIFDKEIREFIPPHSTPQHLDLLLRGLEKTEPGAVTNVSKTFHDLAERIKRRGLIIVVSDLFDEPLEVMRGLRHFRFKKHEVMIFHVFDKWEIEFPFKRLADFVDMETNERLQVDPRYVRGEYRSLIEGFIAGYKRDCASALVEYVQTDTSVPYDFMLSAYLAKRKRLF